MSIARAITTLAIFVLGAMGYRGVLYPDGALGTAIVGLACLVFVGFNIIQAATKK